MEDIKTAVKCDNMLLAEEIRDALADEGITCMIHEENLDPAVGAYGALPGIAVRVYESKLKSAKGIIARLLEERKEKTVEWCPECGSEDIMVLSDVAATDGSRLKSLLFCLAIAVLVFIVAIYLSRILIIALGVSMLAFVPYFFGNKKKNNRHCNKCGKDYYHE